MDLKEWLKKFHPIIWNNYLDDEKIDLTPKALHKAKELLGELAKNPIIKPRKKGWKCKPKVQEVKEK